MNKAINILNEQIKEDDKVIISCSGGPDSMYLMNLLVEYKKDKNITIICAHVNHNVREESKEEEEFVKKFCLDNNIIFESYLITSYKGNFHNDARVIRYKFIENIVNKYNSKIVLTAHHGDDLVESILMKIARGSNLSGYIGFKKVTITPNYKVLKPLIYLTKEEIINYNNEHNIEFRIDKTNYSEEYTRNRYRHNILPVLKKEDKLIHTKYIKFSEKLEEYDSYIKDSLLKTNVIEDNNILVENYKNLDNFMKKRAIEHLITLTQQENELYVNDNTIIEIDKLISSLKGKAYINLSNGFICDKKNKKISIKKEENML